MTTNWLLKTKTLQNGKYNIYLHRIVINIQNIQIAIFKQYHITNQLCEINLIMLGKI